MGKSENIFQNKIKIYVEQDWEVCWKKNKKEQVGDLWANHVGERMDF